MSGDNGKLTRVAWSVSWGGPGTGGLVGFITTSSVAVLARLGEDGSMCSPSAMSRDVVDERVEGKAMEKEPKPVVLLLARVQNCNYYPRACVLPNAFRAPRLTRGGIPL